MGHYLGIARQVNTGLRKPVRDQRMTPPGSQGHDRNGLHLFDTVIRRAAGPRLVDLTVRPLSKTYGGLRHLLVIRS